MRAQEQLAILEATTATDLWREDLSAFEQGWQKLKSERTNEKKTIVIQKKSSKKMAK
jgi:hypothetical protein